MEGWNFWENSTLIFISRRQKLSEGIVPTERDKQKIDVDKRGSDYSKIGKISKNGKNIVKISLQANKKVLK